ncbi:MAG: chromosome segregation protein SMC [Ruminococcus sp.]|nr:chromosome segregation protein SMC [Ruminococcus sp.]
MYLRSLELQGFKSFPDKIKLDFNKGISAVVGPNGSGKSNIGDAMRWVMGEQSSKTLRGGKMEDVIFLGTKTRPKAGFAHVTLTIDNEDRSLNFDSDLVSVSRKLYRNGDSEYMINGANVRLKDVVELFMDTGLGRDGYSIIGQGRIADIVSSKSTERREIFEEAAGISKFRYKKAEAERKLASAEDNISRLNDILGELEGRIGPLKKQSEKAKQFRVLDDEKSKLEISVWVYKLDKYTEELNGFDAKLSDLDKQYSQLTSELDKLENDIEDSFSISAEKSAKIDELKEKIHEVELENSESGAKIAVLENDIAHLEDGILQLKEQIEQSRNSKYFLETELGKRKEDLIRLDKDAQQLESEISEKEKEFEEFRSISEQFDKSIADSSGEINSLYLKKSEYSFKIEAGKNTLSDIETAVEQTIENKNELESKEKFISKEINDLRASKRELEEKSQESTNQLAGFEKLYSAKNDNLEKSLKDFSDNDIKLRECQQKLNLLNDLENSMEGFAYSVKHIIKASKQGRISGVFGSVAQIITVEPEYNVAIETALGGSLQNIVVENEESAKRGIRLLKESKAGRATFLPLTSVKGTRLDKDLENEEGFVALGCDLAKADEKFSGVINSLLGRVCIVEDIDLASVIAKKYGYKFKIVTLDGQIINAGGYFTGGSVSKTTGILTRKSEIKAIEQQTEKLKSEHEKINLKVEHLKQETAKLFADMESAKEQISLVNNEILKLDMEIKRGCEIRAQYEEQLDSIDMKLEEYKSKIKANEKELEESNKNLTQIDKDIFEKEAEFESSQNKLSELKVKRESLTIQLADMRMKAIEVSKDRESCQLSIEQLVSTIESNDNDSGKLDEKIIMSEKDIHDKQREIELIKERMSGSDGRVAEIDKAISVARREHMELDKQANQLRSQQKIKMEEKETLSAEITRLSERKISVTADFDKLAGQLWDEYELTRTEAQQRAESFENITDANRQLVELRGKIKALGNVNLGAIEEYAEVSERFEFMSEQLGDVTRSKLELEDLISDLTENMKAIFTDSFYKINENFKKIFTEMFGGGHGELILADPENVLECGIDIKVEPPGKVIKNLMSLSGGEQAFVAIAIYFSILKVRPSPFCLLDEIEAALDDVNVSRYAQYLHKFTDTTQFITITHRRGTMEEADVLYGVTMQENGISKLLKMNMEDTKQMKLE